MSETKQTLTANMYDILVNNLNKKIVDENNAKKEEKLQKGLNKLNKRITENTNNNASINNLLNKQEIQRVRTEVENNRKTQAQSPESTTNLVSNLNVTPDIVNMNKNSLLT
jgi:septal ring factor EnvC (AmiA/AmiB activator)